MDMYSKQPRSQVAWGALLVLLCFVLPVHAKSQQPESEEWPPISKEEWALNDDPTNPGAGALILYREVAVDDVKSVETDSYRIKILTDEGKKYADVEIPYLEKAYRIEGIRARTVQPDATALQFSGEVFDKLVAKAKKVRFQAKTFTLAGVRPGTIIEYLYQMHWREKFPDVLNNPAGYIIKESDATPTTHWVIPEDLFMRRARFSLRPLPQGQLVWVSMGLPKDTPLRRQADGSVLLELTNIPAFVEEPLMPPERILKSRVDFFYVIGTADASSFWRSKGNQMTPIYENFIGNSKNIRNVVNQTVAPSDPDETKLRKLYTRAQQIRFVSLEAGKTEKEEKRENLKDNKNAEDVLKHGYGFADEINLLFVALARAAGFGSAPALVAARDRAFFQKNSLDRSQLDAMVAWVKVGTKDYYFDPATRFCPYNLLPWNKTAAGGIRLEKDTVETGLFAESLYQDTREKLLEIPAADPGNVIGYEYERRRRPSISQDTWRFQHDIPVRRARFELQLPAGWEYQVFWVNHPTDKAQAVGQNGWVWELSDLPAVESEPSMPAWRSLAGRLGVTYYPHHADAGAGSFGSWPGIANWYAHLAAERREATPEIRQKVGELTANAATPMDKIRALTAFVQSDIRYVAIEIGIGGYQPHPAADVFTNRYGDCKDKATLLATMLAVAGIKSYYVLIDATRGEVVPEAPSALDFDHVILAIRLPEGTAASPGSGLWAIQEIPKLGKLLFFDPTHPFVPLGFLPDNLQSNYGLIVSDEGGELVSLPLLPAVANRLLRTAKLSLTPNGTLYGTVTEVRWGAPAAELRARLLHASQADRQKVLENFVGEFLGGSVLQNATLGKSTSSTPIWCCNMPLPPRITPNWQVICF
jgi:transglutaminase-like putative cysteine protease